ncbi:MAG: hypothetical protein H6Q70_2735 [Firmicutes bacterium]|nr:hypothetical protein [Bacillota bacterium]
MEASFSDNIYRKIGRILLKISIANKKNKCLRLGIFKQEIKKFSCVFIAEAHEKGQEKVIDYIEWGFFSSLNWF